MRWMVLQFCLKISKSKKGNSAATCISSAQTETCVVRILFLLTYVWSRLVTTVSLSHRSGHLSDRTVQRVSAAALSSQDGVSHGCSSGNAHG